MKNKNVNPAKAKDIYSGIPFMGKDIPRSAAEAIKGYRNIGLETDLFGSYTGNNLFDPEDNIPVQDVDDL